ncbi:hypothetical protein DLH72_02950 [Candidatus Gracilibacteria bacterium]|nr:MAG: hypothetical protein DLH72_02950 [Candidatus Gracilibacteria bacterium]
MSINKKIQKNRLNTKFKKIKKIEKKKSTKSVIKIIIYIILFFIITGFLLLIVLYNKYLRGLDVEKLKDLQIAESSILYDRNGKEMYKFFKEKRTYVEYEKISKNIINALVAGEDKRYWENPGVDVIGLIRAGIYFLTGKSDSIGGTSTLTQQLIRNTIIKNRSSNETITEGIDRKIKEIFLSYKLTKSLSKQKIIELYLNKIEFGHNSFGIEEATKTFFNKNAKDANIFEASILASLPKGPSQYSPYNHQDRVVGYLNYNDGKIIEDETIKGTKTTKKLITKEEVESQKDLVDTLKGKISKLKGSKIAEGSNKYMICGVEKALVKGNFNIDKDGCLVLDYNSMDNFISSIEVKSDERTLSYNAGRKDYILQRMLEDNYITFDDYKKAIIEGMGYTFNRQKERITAPHFVFYVKEYLEEKYGKDSISTGGLKIYTTLDLDLQKKAEEIVLKQTKQNSSKFNAKNSALVTIDNKTGGVLVMVGNEDYFSENGKGNVNVITSRLQPGSSFKPFVYSLAMYQNQIGTKTPVYDLEMTFPGNYKPKNFDGRFMGKISISTALNHSRNIPAIKMFYMTKGVKDVVDFMHKLGANSLKYDEGYGASIALGTGEMTPLDLAKAYSVFANMGEKVELNPILKIVDSKGNVIEEIKEGKKERVMTSGQAFLINNILSDSSSRPSGWNSYLNIGRPSAAKTGTSTKPIKQGGKTVQYPANLWTIGYTPQVTTVVWSGNIDGETLKYSGSGLEASAPIWRDFMSFYHKGKEVKNWEKPSDVKNVTISEISGYLPNPENEENNFLVSSYFINPPKKIDRSYQVVEYDALCNGKVTEQTPKAAIKRSVILEFHSLKPDNSSWEAPVQAWAKSSEAIAKYGVSTGLETAIKNEVCKRDSGGGNITIKSNLSSNKNYSTGTNPIDIAFISNSAISKLEIFINGELVQSVNMGNKNSAGINHNLIIPEKFANSRIKVELRAVNEEYFSGSEIVEINVGTVSENTVVPNNNTDNKENKKSDLDITITNPKNSSIKIYREDYFNLRFNISPKEKLSNVNIFINENMYKSIGNSGEYVLAINQDEKLELGISNLKIQAVDSSGKIKEKMLQIQVLKN